MNSFAFPPHDKRYVRTLLQWRWLVLAVSALSVLLFELAEGHGFDIHLVIEMALFGLAVPFMTWLLLTALARNIAGRIDVEHNLQQHRQLTQRLARYQEWDELTEYVARFAGTFLSAERAALFIYDHCKAQLEPAAAWNATGALAPPAPQPPGYKACQTCLLSTPAGLHAAAACGFRAAKPGERLDGVYCLPLAYNKVLIGVLYVVGKPGQSIAPDRAEFMAGVSSEIALALAMAIAHPRQMTQARAEAQLDERRRIAYDLHASLAQQIGYLHLALDRIATDDGVARLDLVRQEMEYMRQVASDAYERIRSNLAILRSWETTDLVQAVETHAQAIAHQSNLSIDVTSSGDAQPLEPPWSRYVFGLIQEGLNNVASHARARRARVTLTWTPDRLDIALADDGIGFDLRSVPGAGHYGLAMMAERVRDLRGEFAIDSAPGEGTTLNIRIPLRRPVAPEAAPASRSAPLPA